MVITLFPAGEPGKRLDERPIAHLKLIPDPQLVEDPLFAHILNRRTNRNAYDTSRSMTPDALREIPAVAATSVIAASVWHGPLLQKLRTLTRDALWNDMVDPPAFQETIDLMRIGRVEIEANPDDIYLGGVFLETLNVIVVLTWKNWTTNKLLAQWVSCGLTREAIADSNRLRPAAVTCAWPCALRVWAWPCNP